MPASSESRVVDKARYVAGDVISSKYRLVSVLGEGGMGAVWRALNVQLDAPVAIKLIRADLDRELLAQRLKQEARAAAKLGHPAIVRIFDVGETELGDPFIVMELLNGRSLAAVLLEERRLQAVQAVQLVLPLADALSVAHAKGIVHRDLKPDNVFIAIDDGRVQPKLVDFGIVKMSDQGQEPAHLTQAGTVLGSPEYMSPEQARGREDVDHRTDMWSFCVLLYEAVAGSAPFAGSNYNALLRSIVEDEPRSILEHLAGDQRLWEIIRRGLAKGPDARFPSMTELGTALAAWLVSQGVHEDVCGTSLDAKWIARTSDPLIRASRASLASLATLPPESGVRTADRRAAVAPTVDAAAVGGDAVKSGVSRFSTSRLLLVGGAVAVAAAAWIAIQKTRAAEISTQLAEPPRSQAATAAQSAPNVQSAFPVTSASAAVPSSTAATSSVAVVVEPMPSDSATASAASVHPVNGANAAPRVAKKPGHGVAMPNRPPATPHNDAAHDLISPY